METEIVGKESSLKACIGLLSRMSDGWSLRGYGQYSPIYFQQKDNIEYERAVGNRGGRKWVIIQTMVKKEEVGVK